MASEQLTEYERRRLENIKRNDEMMASLKIHSRLSQLSAASKRRHREEKKTYKQSPEKKPKPETPVVIRRSLRTRGIAPDSDGLPKDFNDSQVTKSNSKPMRLPSDPAPLVLGPLSMRDAYQAGGSSQALVHKFTTRLRKPAQLDGENGDDEKGTSLRVCSNSNSNIADDGGNHHHLSSSPVKFERVKVADPIDVSSLRLEPGNIARLVPGRIFSVWFLPTTDMTMVVAGNKFGNLGLWDVNAQNEQGDGVYLYRPHSAPISGISVHPFSLSKVYTCCYDGLLRLMDIEKEVFDLVYSGSELFSLFQHPDDANSILFGEGQGDLNLFDGRKGQISTSWSLHEGRINSIDFNPANTNIVATSSSDGLACLWDLRKMDVNHPKPKALQTVEHGRAVHSAYFSPSGSCMATTSFDNNVGVLRGANFEDKFMIPHDNWINRWLSSFRAVWGWDDTHLYIGSMKRRVDVLSVTQRKTVYAIQSPLMSAIPCRYDSHPCKVGMLAGATSGGQVYIWTPSSSL